MARFFIHLKSDGELITDEDGVDLPDLSEAAREAIQCARELLAEAIKNAKLEVPEAILVADEAGQTLLELPLLDVLPQPLRKKILMSACNGSVHR